MGALLLSLALFAAPALRPDTLPPFADSATRAVVLRAQARQRSQDTLVTDYTAHLHYRMSFALGRRRWARIPPFGVAEQDAVVHWQRPNDLRVDVLGRRAVSRSRDADLSAGFDRPWFVPRALGDSVRILGSDFPSRAALHPFAADGPEWYRYALTDSMRISAPDGRLITLLGITVTPRREAPALVAGVIWVDAATADVVRFSFRYVGTGLWVTPDGATHEDSVDAERGNRWANRILTVDADLEYALVSGVHWMPFRQTISGQAVIPFVGDLVVPFTVSTTFDDYEVNTGARLTFSIPLDDTTAADSAVRRARERTREADSTGARNYAGRLEGGGRYELHVAPRDSLKAYAGWRDSLVLDRRGDDRADLRQVEADLAALTEDLPGAMTGRPGFGFAYERLADLFRYNRVSGFAPGFGVRAPVPGVPFTSAFATARYGFTDRRITGRVDLVREAPSGRLTLSGYRELAPVDRGFPAGLLANSVNALFTAHDAADWTLAEGGSLRYETSVARGLELTLAARGERLTSVGGDARSAVNDFLGGDGRFQPNPAVTDGEFGGATVLLEGRSGGVRWMAGMDGIAGRAGATAKVFGEWRAPLPVGRAQPALTLRGGITTGDPLPQEAFRLGGPWTVRALPYGTVTGQAFWAAQLDVPLHRGPVRPVLFADLGQAGPAASVFRGRVYSGVGAGLSILGGAIRFDLSQPIGPDAGGVRFDLVFGGAR